MRALVAALFVAVACAPPPATCDPRHAECPRGETCAVDTCVVVDDPGLCDPIDESDGRAAMRIDGFRAAAPTEITAMRDVVDVGGDVILAPPRPPGPSPLAIGTLCPLVALQRVDGALVIAGTDVARLDGLQALAAIGKGLLIFDNPSLRDVAALQAHLAYLGEGDGRVAGRHDAVIVARNPSLSADAVAALKQLGAPAYSCGNTDEAPCSDAIGQSLDALYGGGSL